MKSAGSFGQRLVERNNKRKKLEKGKFAKKTLTSDMSPSDRFSVPRHRLQAGPIVRTGG
jgi:hypothetical protein